MPIDSFTVLFFGLFIKLVLGALFIAYWMNSRGSPWFGWWSATLILGSGTSALFMLRASVENFFTIGIGNALLIAAFTCLWQGARSFERRDPLWLLALAPPVLWLVLAAIPAVMENLVLRIVLSSSICAPLLFLTAAEF